MLIAIELQTSRVYVSFHPQSLIVLSQSLIRARKIALHDENAVFRCAKAQLQGQLGLFHGQRFLVAICRV